MNRSIAALLLCIVGTCNTSVQATTGEPVVNESSDNLVDSDEAAIEEAVERFLFAIGDNDYEALPPMFMANANIGSARFRDGKWVTKTHTFDEFHSMLTSRSNPSKYQEPVSKFTVHVDRGVLAFVRADATLVHDGQPRSHNIDYFTLLKENGVWKFLSASYVTTPIKRK